MDINFDVKSYFSSLINVLDRLDIESFETAINLIQHKFEEGKKIIVFGNGGSAYTASHYITDWNKMINLATGKKFRGFSLCDNIGLITALGNDISYDDIFTGQLNAILDSGDLVIAISGSGNSTNVLKAVDYANSNGAVTLGIIGYDGGQLIKRTYNHILVPSYDMQICEDIHLMFGHMVMKKICNSKIKIDG